MVVNIFSNFVLIIKIYAYIGIARMFTKSKKLDLLKDKTRLETYETYSVGVFFTKN